MSKAFQIKDFPDYYATDSGDIYSRNYRNTGRIKKLSPGRVGSGYLAVDLWRNRHCYRKLVHRLIAETFIPNPDKKTTINHKNGHKDDNRVENLEWVTYKENLKHCFDVLGRKGTWLGKFGKNHGSSKPVLQIKDGVVIAEFYGATEAQRATGINASSIRAACLGVYKTAGGYQWKRK